MRPLKKLLFILCILIIISSCVEEFWPQLNPSDEKLLVVEGFISNTLGPYTIKLSTTRSLDSIPATTKTEYDFDPFTNAEVKIIDDLGDSETLSETSPGIYKTSENGMQGQVGRMYKLTITSESGNIYESGFEKILAPIEIESIEYQEIQTKNKEEGFLFNVTTANLPEEDSYFKWEVEETYEYHSPYKPTHYFNGGFSNDYYDLAGNYYPGSMIYSEPYNLKELDYAIDSILYCWSTNKIKKNYFASSQYLSESAIRNFPLNFVAHGNEKIRIKYSILVRQHRISELTYSFINQIEEQNSYDNKELYTKQPYQIRGNVHNINNTDEPVLGLFYTISTTEKRAFLPPDNIPMNEILYRVEYCKNIPSVYYDPIVGPINDIISFISTDAQTKHNIWPIYFCQVHIYHPKLIDPISWPVWFASLSKSCSDCRLRGGSNEKPDYWE